MTLLSRFHQYKLPWRRLLHSAYLVKPKTRAQEQEKQACYLTKTLVRQGIPSSMTNAVQIAENEREYMIDSIKRCIIETNYFHRDEKLVIYKRASEENRQRLTLQSKSKLSLQLLLNMMRVVWSSPSARDAGFQTKNISYRPDIVAPWERLDKKIQVSGKIGHLINGKSLLPLFADENQVQMTQNEELVWDDIISPFFDIHPNPSVFQPNRGFHSGSPYPCPQTLLILNPYTWKSRFNSGLGVFYSFAHAMTYALSEGAEMGKDLVQPIPIQCIVFNGTSFYFVCYQLNTLNFADDNTGIKNLTWIHSDEKLYDEVTDIPSESTDFIEYTSKRVSLVDYNRKVLTDDFVNEQRKTVSINGFNRQAVNMFIDFMFHPYNKEIS